MSVPHCDHEPRSRHPLSKPIFVSKPIGSFSVAGAQMKTVAIEVTEIDVCDPCWERISPSVYEVHVQYTVPPTQENPDADVQ